MRIILAILMIMVTALPAVPLDHDIARQVVAEMNLARTRPKTYAGFIREFKKRFTGKTFSLPGSTTTRVQTNEGVNAVNEAIKFLTGRKSLPPLTWSDELAAAAAELAEEQGRTGATGHGKQSQGMQERIERQGKWRGQIGENIGYGPTEAREMVMQLIIDDGVPDRGHRKNTFNPAFRTAGAAWSSHPRFDTVCVINFAGELAR